MDITNAIQQQDWSGIADTKMIYSNVVEERECIAGTAILYYMERGEPNSFTNTYRCGKFVWIGNSIKFGNGEEYKDEFNPLTYLLVKNATQCGVVIYAVSKYGYAPNTFISSGKLSGCTCACLIFKDIVLFIHEGGEYASENTSYNTKESRCYDIYVAICKVLKIDWSYNIIENSSHVGVKWIDWLINSLENLPGYICGSIIFKADTNVCKGNTKKTLYHNYNSNTDIIMAQLLCIFEQDTISICSMAGCTKDNNKFSKTPDYCYIKVSDY